jgi:hypothetical protein
MKVLKVTQVLQLWAAVLTKKNPKLLTGLTYSFSKTWHYELGQADFNLV